jgi:hypothetical protein
MKIPIFIANGLLGSPVVCRSSASAKSGQENLLISSASAKSGEIICNP